MKSLRGNLTEYELALKLLKEQLRVKKIRYKELAQAIGVSESGLKKILNAQDGSVLRLSQICRYVGASLIDLFQVNESMDVSFSPEQQKIFSENPVVFRYYWHLVYERMERIQVDQLLKLKESEAFKVLRKLDQLKLIKLLPSDRLRIPSVRPVRWRGRGEFITKIYRDWSVRFVEQLARPEPIGDELFFVRYLRMTPRTYAEFKAAMVALETEFVRRSVREMQLVPNEVHHVRCLGAIDGRGFFET